MVCVRLEVLVVMLFVVVGNLSNRYLCIVRRSNQTRARSIVLAVWFLSKAQVVVLVIALVVLFAVVLIDTRKTSDRTL